MNSIPYFIDETSITVFLPEPVVMEKTHKHYAKVFEGVTSTPQQPVGNLRELVDLRHLIVKSTDGQLRFEEDGTLYFNKDAINHDWAEKIVGLHGANLPVKPVLEALRSLLDNPTPEAITRLPRYLEKSRLGFMPDGRIAGFKVVRDDYMDKHTNTILYAIGTTVTLARNLCDNNPDNECSTGLHIGSYGYIVNYGGPTDRLLLVAFWPKDVVSVPGAYGGDKLRVCSMDVIEQLDKEHLLEFIEKNQHLVGPIQTEEDPEYAGDGGDGDGDGDGDDDGDYNWTYNDWEEEPLSQEDDLRQTFGLD